MKDLAIIVSFLVLFAITVYERLTFGVASAYFIFPALFLIPFMLMSFDNIIKRSKNKLKIR